MKKILSTLLVLSIISTQFAVLPANAQFKLSSRISKDKITQNKNTNI